MLQKVKPLTHSPSIITSWPAKAAILPPLRGIQSGVVIHEGALIWGTVNSRQSLRWASCARNVIANSSWLDFLTKNEKLRELLLAKRSIWETGARTAFSFPESLSLYELLWYLDAEGRWGYSKGWREADDLFWELSGEYLHDYFNNHLAEKVPGIIAFENKVDGTPRFEASAADAAKWGYAMLHNLFEIDLELLKHFHTPGNFYLEGMGGNHLIRAGEAWELKLPGCPSGFMARDGNVEDDHGHGVIACFPSLDLVVAARGASPEWYLSDICRGIIG